LFVFSHGGYGEQATITSSKVIAAANRMQYGSLDGCKTKPCDCQDGLLCQCFGIGIFSSIVDVKSCVVVGLYMLVLDILIDLA
jgi:hypothetical protein